MDIWSLHATGCFNGDAMTAEIPPLDYNGILEYKGPSCVACPDETYRIRISEVIHRQKKYFALLNYPEFEDAFLVEHFIKMNNARYVEKPNE